MIKIPTSDLYKHDLREHAKNPRNYGLLPDADFCSEQLNPSCGDSVTICGLVRGRVVEKVQFEGAGCILSLAMASKLTEYVVGMDQERIAMLDDSTVELLLGIELGINRLQCGLLSIRALQQGMKSVVNTTAV